MKRGGCEGRGSSSVNLGNTSVDIVSDGTYMLDGGSMFGQVPKPMWETSMRPDRKNRIRLGLNCLLVRTPTKNVLIDTGSGSKRLDKLRDAYGLNGNKLLRELKKLRLTPRDIDIVVLTHLHFDHGGGSTKLDRAGNILPTFPKAEYLVQRDCWEEAMEPNERGRSSYVQDDYLPLYERGVLKLLDGDQEITPGVSVKVTNGHSNGHQIALIEAGSEKIVYAGDLIPTPHHLPLPFIPATDQWPNDTLDQKRQVLDMAVRGGWLVIFGHGYDQRAGYVEQRNGRPQLLPIGM